MISRKPLVANIIISTSLLTVIFLLSIALDVSPYLRGPHDPLLESHWPYYFVNTISKIWLPLIIFCVYSSLFFYIDRTTQAISRKKELLYLVILILIALLFQLSLVYFSRFGLGILFRRVADPGINGYFSTAYSIQSVAWLLHNYQHYFPHLLQHARGHPPGGVILYRLLIDFFTSNPTLSHIVLSYVSPPKDQVSYHLWSTLSSAGRAAAVASGLVMHILSVFSLIPLYYLSKQFLSTKGAYRTIFLFGLLPSFVFFPVFLDPLYIIFPLLSLLFIVLASRGRQQVFTYISGICMGVGLLFSVSFIPEIGMVLIFLDKQNWAKQCVLLFMGLITSLLCMYVLGFNSISSFPLIITGQAPRTYSLWLFYDVYDFFVYLGVPLSLLFFYSTYSVWKQKLVVVNRTYFLWAFWILFITLDVSGVSRGETGRIWIFFMGIPVIVVSWFTTYILPMNSKIFFVLLLLLFLQDVIMEEFWVPIW